MRRCFFRFRYRFFRFFRFFLGSVFFSGSVYVGAVRGAGVAGGGATGGSVGGSARSIRATYSIAFARVCRGFAIAGTTRCIAFVVTHMRTGAVVPCAGVCVFALCTGVCVFARCGIAYSIAFRSTHPSSACTVARTHCTRIGAGIVRCLLLKMSVLHSGKLLCLGAWLRCVALLCAGVSWHQRYGHYKQHQHKRNT